MVYEPTTPLSGSLQEVVEKCDDHLEKNELDACIEILQSAYDKGERHCDLSFRIGRHHYLIAENIKDKEKEKAQELYDLGMKLLEEAKDLDPNHPDMLVWYGVCIAGTVALAGPKENISKAYVVREYFDKAIEIDPKNILALHCIGAWCYEICQIGWLARQAASVLFATPPTSTLEEAKDYLEKAEEFDEKKRRNDLLWNRGYLALTYYKMRDYDSAKKWLSKVEAIDPLGPQEKEFAKKVLDKRSKCK